MGTSWRWMVALAGLLLARDVLAAPPLRRWQTIQTACCDLTYHDGLDEEARHFARAAQESHESVVKLLGYAPEDRTQFILTDDTDFSNGSATPVPYNVIRVFARPPAAFSDLADYDDWARALVVHEYTHIVHTDYIRGVPWVLNAIFGKWWPPNILQPRWFIEGLAVFVETRLTTSGRAQSGLFDMYLRTAALNGRLWELDVLSSGGRAFPSGNGAYLYGGHFLTWLANRYGDHVWADISRSYGAHAFPYAMDHAAEKSFGGKSYRELYQEWRLELTADALALQARVEKEGRTPERRLTSIGQSVLYPRRLHNGDVVFYAGPMDDSPGLYVARARAGKTPDVFRVTEVQNVQGLSPTPDGTGVVFAQPEVYSNNYSYLDLFRADLRTGEVTRITAGARVRDPDVHPDGRAAIAVENQAGRSRLVLVDLSTGVTRGVFSFPDGSEIHSPRFNARGDAVVFTAWRPGGFRDVFMLRPGDQEATRLTSDRDMDMHPCFSPDGKAVYFSSDRGGVYNIYRHDLEWGQTRQVTNVVTGAFMPLPLEQDQTLLYVGFNEDAFDLYAAPLVVDALPVARAPDERPPAKPLPEVAISKPEPYSPFFSALPRVWRPVLQFNSLFGITVGAAVSGEDLTGYHAYQADVRVTLPRGDYVWSLGYQYNGLPFPLLLSATGYASRLALAALGDGVRGNYVEDVVRGEVATQLPLGRWRQYHSVTMGYGWEFRLSRTRANLRPDGLLPNLPRSGPTGYLSFSYLYSNVRAFRDSVSVERGRRIRAGVRVGHPYLISRHEIFEATAEYREYMEVPLMPRHVWFLSVQGGVARGDVTRRRSFFLGGLPPVASFFAGSGFLRGYPLGALIADGYLLMNAEWRFPLLEMQQGFGLVPVFVDRLRGVVFFDQGVVFRDFPRGGQLKRGVGAELLLDTTMFFVVPLTLRAGLARGLDPGGLEMQWYMALGADS